MSVEANCSESVTRSSAGGAPKTGSQGGRLDKVPILLELVARPLPPTVLVRSIVHQLKKGSDRRDDEAGREDEERVPVADAPHC